jgi:hypothetical protein
MEYVRHFAQHYVAYLHELNLKMRYRNPQPACKCGTRYVRETGRPPNIRIMDHKQNTKMEEITKPKTAEHSWYLDHGTQGNKAKILHTGENRYMKKLNETVFIKTEEQVISQPSVNVNTIWHTMLLRQEVGI